MRNAVWVSIYLPLISFFFGLLLSLILRWRVKGRAVPVIVPTVIVFVVQIILAFTVYNYTYTYLPDAIYDTILSLIGAWLGCIGRSNPIESRRVGAIRIFLIASQIVYVVTLPFGVLAISMSRMVFDTSSTLLKAITVFTAISAYPIAVIVSSVIAWILYRKRKLRASIYVNLIPCLWYIAIAVLVVTSIIYYPNGP